MFDTLYVGGAATRIDAPEALPGYSKVIIKKNDDLSFTAGDNTGRTLNVTCPWGSQEMAEELLARVQGHGYQPYQADSAVIDPAFEIGDAVQLSGAYGGIYSAKMTMGRNPRTTLSAPHNEEVNDYTPYKSSEQREITRSFQDVRATLRVTADQIAAEVTARENAVTEIVAALTLQAGQIEAKVSREGGDNRSFGWKMLDDSQTWYANGSEIVRFDQNGAVIRGRIEALSGKIGGFDIKSDCLSYNGQTWGGTNTYGAYLGTSGFQMGDKLKISMDGRIEAEEGVFHGSVQAGNIDYGGDAGYFSGGGLSGGSVYGSKIAGSTLSTAKFTAGVNTSLGYADFSYDAMNGRATASLFQANYAKIKTLEVSKLVQYNSSTTLSVKMICYVDGNTGDKKYIQVFCA